MKLTPFLTSLLFIAGALLTACGSATPSVSSPPMPLSGTSWALIRINGQTVAENTLPTLIIDGNAVGGNASCNSFGGDFSQEGDQLRFGPLFSTMMACLEPGCMEQEAAYMQALEAAVGFRIESGQLTLFDEEGQALLVFDPYQPPLGEKTWILTAYAVPPGMTTPLPDARVTAQFTGDAVRGSAGCNEYSAPYTQDGETIRFDPAISTEMFCVEPEGLMQQESEFLNAFGLAVSYKIEGRMLNFYNDKGLSAFGQADGGRVFGAQPGVRFTFGVADEEDVHVVNYSWVCPGVLLQL